MKKNFLSFVVCAGLVWNCQAQKTDLNNFQYLQCEGELPVDFTTLSSEKYKIQLHETKQQKANKHVDKHTQDFLLFSNYLLDELLLSGKVLFNDPITQYVNKVAANLLKNEPNLEKQLRFYTVKSTEQNAFATHQGMIFVTTGLLAELENEAQLAFVLSHEIVHFEKKHVITGYVEEQKVLNGEGKERYNSSDERIRKISNYSKEKELEADSLGFIRFAASGYSLKASHQVMDVLQFADLPFYEKPFEFSYLETKDFKIPATHILDSVKQIDFTAHLEDDKYSSHPNLNKRSTLLRKFESLQKNPQARDFELPKDEFMYMQALVRLEHIRLLLMERQYPELIHEAALLLKNEYNGTNKYLEKSIAKALYGIAKYKWQGNYGDCGDHYSEVEGEIQRTYFFMHKLTNTDAGLLACHNLYNLQKKYPEDAFLTELRDDIFQDLIRRDGFGLKKIQKELELIKKNEELMNKPVSADTIVEADTSTTGLTKLEILRKKREEEERKNKKLELARVTEHDSFYKLFLDLYESPEFADYLGSMERKIEADKAEALAASSKEKKPFIRAGRSQTKKMAEKLPENLDKIVWVDPFFVTLDRSEEIQYIESESKLIKIKDIIEYSCKKTGMGYDFLAPKSFGSADVERYNHLSRLNDWMDEALDHDKMSIIPLQAENVQDLAQIYGTTHFAYTGVLHVIVPKDYVGSYLLYGVLFYPILPYIMVKLLTPAHRTLFYTTIINLKKGKAEYDDFSIIEASDNLHMVSSIIYDQINQMTLKK